MERAKTILAKLAQPRVLMTIVVVAIFLASAIFAYNRFVKPKMEAKYVDNKEFLPDSQGDSKEAIVYYFTAEWCPVSKRVFSQWEKFVGDYEGKTINGYKVVTRVVDCEKETGMADKFGIEGYPTVKLVYDNQVIEYDANVKYETLVEFLTSSLGGKQ